MLAETIDLLISAPSNEASIARDLGRPEYSYYFVMKRFLPLLEQFGRPKRIATLDGLEAECSESRRFGRLPILICFAPPHLLPIAPPCVVVPVFAWEYDNIPNETWTGDSRQNWVETLRPMPAAVTHSEHSRRAVMEALGDSWPVASIPAPVFDTFNAKLPELWDGSPRSISFDGTMVDSSCAIVKSDGELELRQETGRLNVTVQGPVFTSVLSPWDGRKNLPDLVTAFVWAFRNEPDATLILKLNYFDPEWALEPVTQLLHRLYPYHCRIIAISAFLDDEAYEDLIRATAFAVNASVGEGQCLPLMEFLSAGRPAVAPNHTAMADYIDDQNAMIVKSSLEWTCWPPDPRWSLRCMQHRIHWDNLRAAYSEAYRIATCDAERYRQMSLHARERLRQHNSTAVALERLATVMEKVVSHAAQQEELKTGSSGLMKLLLGVETGRANPRLIGVIDAQISGWFRAETGELFKGFQIASLDTVVDVGCGEGQHLSFCARFNARIIGIDIDKQALAVTRSALSNAAANAFELHEASAEHLPLEDSLATRIICSEVLEHVDDPSRALAELARIGAPGALYLLTVPDKASEELQRHVAPDLYFHKPNHVRVFERDALPRLAEEAGLEVLSHTAYGFFSSVWWGLFWACGVDLSAPDHPTLLHWSEAWAALLDSPDGARIKAGLDAFLPKSRVVLARKPAS